MKKLMIAAATAAMIGGAYAADCTPPDVEQPELECASVYAVKMTVKTTKGVMGSVTAPGVDGSLCLPGEPGEVSQCIYRASDSTKFEGWIYDCACECGTISSGSVVMWDSKRKAQLNAAAFEETILNVMGKKADNAEYAWGFTGTAAYDEGIEQGYTLTGAGLGKFDTKAGRFKSFSGNFAGTAAASYYLNSKKNICEPSTVWTCDTLGADCGEALDTVAYGTWTISYNASASKRYLKDGFLKVPAYVTVEQ